MNLIQAIHKMFGISVGSADGAKVREDWRTAVHDYRNSSTRADGARVQSNRVSHLASAEIESTIQFQEHVTGLRRAEMDLIDWFKRK